MSSPTMYFCEVLKKCQCFLVEKKAPCLELYFSDEYFFLISPQKRILEKLEILLPMSTHNICFCGEIRKKISVFFG